MRCVLLGLGLLLTIVSYAEDQEQVNAPQGYYRSMPSFENSQAPGPNSYSKGEGTPDPHFFQNSPHQTIYRKDPTYHGDFYSEQYKRDIFRQPSKKSHSNNRPRSEKRHVPRPSPDQGFPRYPTTTTPSSRL